MQSALNNYKSGCNTIVQLTFLTYKHLFTGAVLVFKLMFHQAEAASSSADVFSVIYKPGSGCSIYPCFSIFCQPKPVIFVVLSVPTTTSISGLNYFANFLVCGKHLLEGVGWRGWGCGGWFKLKLTDPEELGTR